MILPLTQNRIGNLGKRGEEVDVIPTGNASDLDATEDKNEDISIGLLFASKAIVQLIGTGQTSVNSSQILQTDK